MNITTPHMPITSDGKAPDLRPFINDIRDAVQSAVRKGTTRGSGKLSQKAIVLEHLDEVIARVSGDGQYRFNYRQLLYALRPIVRKEIGEELREAHFEAIITDYESEHGEIPGAYHEPRGTLVHPHRDEVISLGTLTVEQYERPPWLFNTLVYIEKEGFHEALREARWAEQHDCALVSSKGFTTRAVRDLVDKLVEHDEPVTVFCVHDADGHGSIIYQTFQEETKARGARKIKIVNLGLEPWEAVAMGLEVEEIKKKTKRKPVADYVRERTDADWEDWLQTHRVELNAMTTPQFIAWLDEKMAPHEGKLIPPPEILEQELEQRIEGKLRVEIAERILREAGYEEQVAAAVAAAEKPDADALAEGIRALFEERPESEWRDYIKAVAEESAQ